MAFNVDKLSADEIDAYVKDNKGGFKLKGGNHPGGIYKHSLYSDQKRRAHSLLNYHIKAGNIKRGTECEAPLEDHKGPIQAAHYDYSEPLKVKWLCARHHYFWDQSKRDANL